MKPADLEPRGGFDCKAGTRLTTTWTEMGKTTSLKVEDTATTWPDGTARAATDAPPKCDNPVWLADNCDGAQQYVQKLDTKNDDVAAVLMCRHKRV